MMTPLAVAASWSRVGAALRTRAPQSARCLRPPALSVQVAMAQRTLGLAFPNDLAGLLMLADGAEPDAERGRLLPPEYLFTGLARMMALWNEQMTVARAEAEPCGSAAGEGRRAFCRKFVPLGEDKRGALLVVDARPGARNGCVLEWTPSQGCSASPLWESVEVMGSDLALALESGTVEGADSSDGAGAATPHVTANGCTAAFTADGRLSWVPAG